MSGLLKGGRINVTGKVDINNQVKMPEQQIVLPVNEQKDEVVSEKATPAQISRECEEIRKYYIDEGEKALALARKAADSIIAKTQAEADKYTENAKLQAEQLFDKSKAEGFAAGSDEGYKKGLLKCKGMLLDLKNMLEKANAEKDELFAGYEVEIFDTVFQIANKITLDSLNQKDKAVIKKTIKEAAKGFRNSDYIKVTLSQSDVTEEMTTDADFFKDLMINITNVEVEYLKDAPSGTVILDNGSEITDASIGTQLKMIEELGAGKYRKAPSPRVKKKLEEQAKLAEENNTAEGV